jgi:DNA-binding transcriptional ArsR family regulator
LKESSAKNLFSILSDESCLKIMEILDKKELNIQQISLSLDLPLSSTYRKVSKLEDLKIIKKTKVMRKLDGSDESFYILWAYEINISYKNNSFTFNIKQKPLDEKIIRLWQKFKS